MDINPIDKIEDVKNKLSDYNTEIKTSSDQDYDWLEDYSVCLVVKNPLSDKDLDILFEEKGEFCIFFAGNHCHYFADEDEYAQMCEDIKSILQNDTCSATIQYNPEKWLGSTFISREMTGKEYNDNFDFVLKHKEFKEKIETYGGIVRYSFWDNNLDIMINIAKKVE